MTDFFVFPNIIFDPTHNVNYKGKQNSEEIRRDKMIKLNLKANNIGWLWASINNVNIALANYAIKQLKSIYLYSSVLVAAFIRPIEMRSQN